MKWLRILLSITLLTILINSCSLLSLTDSDQAAFESLRDAGSDMSQVHPFDFYLYHPDETGAVQLCTQLQVDGFSVIVREGALEGEWLCMASLSFIPSIDKLAELEDKFESLILQFGGEYDGWETIVIQ
jgi:hypothetical protein